MANNTVAARIPDDLEKALEAISLLTDKPVGALIRIAIEQYIKHEWTPKDVQQAEKEYHERQRLKESEVSRKVQAALNFVTQTAD